jgi:hypothetical protein
VAQLLTSSPQNRTRYYFLYDGLGKDGQEKIESLISLRENVRLGVPQRSLVITYTIGFRIADSRKLRQEDTYRSVHLLQVGRLSVAV